MGILDEARLRIQRRVLADQYLAAGKVQTIENILWGVFPDDAPRFSIGFMQEINQSNTFSIDKPILHITGASGAGKSHLARAISLALVLNVWGTNFNLLGRGGFSHVDYPLYMQSIISGEAKSTKWDAPLMVIEGLDAKPPIPKSGDTYWLDKFLALMKPRMRTGLPTILVTRRNGKSLTKFLSMNSYGDIDSRSSISVADDIGLLIALNTMYVIRLDKNIAKLITSGRGNEFYDKISQQDISNYGFKDPSIIWGAPNAE